MLYIIQNSSEFLFSLLWTVLCTLSWCACIVTVTSIVRNFVEKPVAITVDTSYLDWKSPFPTIAICSKFNQAAKEFAAKYV